MEKYILELIFDYFPLLFRSCLFFLLGIVVLGSPADGRRKSITLQTLPRRASHESFSIRYANFICITQVLGCARDNKRGEELMAFQDWSRVRVIPFFAMSFLKYAAGWENAGRGGGICEQLQLATARLWQMPIGEFLTFSLGVYRKITKYELGTLRKWICTKRYHLRDTRVLFYLQKIWRKKRGRRSTHEKSSQNIFIGQSSS